MQDFIILILGIFIGRFLALKNKSFFDIKEFGKNELARKDKK